MKDQPPQAAAAPILESEELYQDHLFNVQCEELVSESSYRISRKAESYQARLLEILQHELQVAVSPHTVRPSLKRAANAHVLPTFATTILLDGFAGKDYKNVYFEKRRQQVTLFAQKLVQFETELGTIYWRNYRSDAQKTSLLLVPPHNPVKFRWLLHFQLKDADWIPPARLLPNRVNGAPQYWYNLGLSEDLPPPDHTINENFPEYLHPMCTLLQIWALQNGLLRGCVEVMDLQRILLYLHRTKRIYPRFTLLNGLRAVWRFLSENRAHVLPLPNASESQTMDSCRLNTLYTTLTKESPLSNNHSDDPPTLLECYASSSAGNTTPPSFFVLLDSAMRHNVLGRWHPAAAATIQYCAQQALQALSHQDAFDCLFVTNRRFWNRYDVYIKVPQKQQQPDECGVLERLRRGLGNRIVTMDALRSGNGEPKLTSSPIVDSDEIPTYTLKETLAKKKPRPESGIVIGLSIHPDHSRRVVDRCLEKDPSAFCEFWGPKAELRRFQDGAIVHACVWEDTVYHNEDISIVAQIVKYLYPEAQISLRNMYSVLDGLVSDKQNSFFTNSLHAHRNILKAFESLSDRLRQPTTLPLTIDAVEALSPALRYAALFSPMPHPLLGTQVSVPQKSGAIVSDPICIQIRFGPSSKWPTELKAIGAAKTAMLLELVKNLEHTSDFGRAVVTPNHADICFRGYVFRLFVRADPELKLLRSLQAPTEEAKAILAKLTKESVVAATHHSLTHAIYTSHPSSSGVVRLIQRWLSSHLLSDQIPFEAVELMVAYVYQKSSPGTVVRGFLSFLHLLSTYDWLGRPLIADPQGHLDDKDCRSIQLQFESSRGSNNAGPAMYIVSPCTYTGQEGDREDKILAPIFTTSNPERVILGRAVALASRTYSFLLNTLKEFDASGWQGIFQESVESFHAYSALLRVEPAFLCNAECSSTVKDLGAIKGKDGSLQTSYTRSMLSLADGPRDLRRKMYRNLVTEDDPQNGVLLEWQPIPAAVGVLREKLGSYALFLYNHLYPEVLGVVWRPMNQCAFSAVSAEFTRPFVTAQWQNDTLVALNVQDVLREAMYLISDCIKNVKCFDYGQEPQPPASKKMKRAQSASESEDTGSSGSDNDSD